MEKMRQKDIKRSREKMDRKIMLDGLQIEAVRHWPTLANLHYKINADVVLPQTILNFGEYQAKLQKLAMYSEQADHKAMQDILDNTEVIE
jgi:hypothetical protein